MKVKTSELIGMALDEAVAMCRGKGIEFECPSDPWLTVDGIADQPLHSYTPSTDWAQGGPIIEKEKISLEIKDDGWWVAGVCRQYNYSRTKEYMHLDHSPLIAAMRCYVASKLGYEVEVPEELL